MLISFKSNTNIYVPIYKSFWQSFKELVCGRYVITGVSWWGHKVDNAYWIWNFQGKIMKRITIDKFCEVCLICWM